MLDEKSHKRRWSHNFFKTIEARIRWLRIHHKDFYNLGCVVFWIISLAATIAITPFLERSWAVVIGAIVIIAVCAFVFLYDYKRATRKRFQFSWQPWLIAFVFAAEITFLGIQGKIKTIKSGEVLAATNTFYLNSLQATNLYFQTTNSFLFGQIGTLQNQIGGLQKQLDDSKRDGEAQEISLKLDIQRITGERDAALSREREAENMPATAISMYSNVNATASNFLAGVGLIGLNFKATLNGIPITNFPSSPFSIVPLDKTRRIFIQIAPIDKTEPPVENLTIDFFAPLDQTNLDIGGQWQPKGYAFSYNGVPFNLWEINTGGALVTSVRGFDATSFCISTNFQQTSLVARFDVFAPRVIGVEHFPVVFGFQ